MDVNIVSEAFTRIVIVRNPFLVDFEIGLSRRDSRRLGSFVVREVEVIFVSPYAGDVDGEPWFRRCCPRLAMAIMRYSITCWW